MINTQSLFFIGLSCCLLVVLAAWFRLQGIVEFNNESKASLERCVLLAAKIESGLDQSSEATAVAKVTYNPGPNIFQAMNAAGIPRQSDFNVMRTPPAETAGTSLRKSSVELPNLELEMPQIIKFITSIRNSGIRHQVEKITLNAVSSRDEQTNKDIKPWNVDFQIFYFVEASNE